MAQEVVVHHNAGLATHAQLLLDDIGRSHYDPVVIWTGLIGRRSPVLAEGSPADVQALGGLSSQNQVCKLTRVPWFPMRLGFQSSNGGSVRFLMAISRRSSGGTARTGAEEVAAARGSSKSVLHQGLLPILPVKLERAE